MPSPRSPGRRRRCDDPAILRSGDPAEAEAARDHGKVGYTLVKDIREFVGQEGTIPVYESDGTTVIGEFPLGDR